MAIVYDSGRNAFIDNETEEYMISEVDNRELCLHWHTLYDRYHNMQIGSLVQRCSMGYDKRKDRPKMIVDVLKTPREPNAENPGLGQILQSSHPKVVRLIDFIYACYFWPQRITDRPLFEIRVDYSPVKTRKELSDMFKRSHL
jgi:hypothetical protein